MLMLTTMENIVHAICLGWTFHCTKSAVEDAWNKYGTQRNFEPALSVVLSLVQQTKADCQKVHLTVSDESGFVPTQQN